MTRSTGKRRFHFKDVQPHHVGVKSIPGYGADLSVTAPLNGSTAK